MKRFTVCSYQSLSPINVTSFDKFNTSVMITTYSYVYACIGLLTSLTSSDFSLPIHCFSSISLSAIALCIPFIHLPFVLPLVLLPCCFHGLPLDAYFPLFFGRDRLILKLLFLHYPKLNHKLGFIFP